MFSRSRLKIILSIMGSLILLFTITLGVILFASYQEIRQENMELLKEHVGRYYLEKETESPEVNGEAETGETATGETADREAAAGETADGAETQSLKEQPPEPPESREDGDREPPPEPPEGREDGDREPPPDNRGEREPDNRQGKPPSEKPPAGYELSTFYSVAIGEDGTILKTDTGDKDVYEEAELISIAENVLAGGKDSGRTGNLTYIISRRPNYTLVAFMDNTVSESSLATLLHNVLIIGSGAILIMFFVSLFLSKRIIRPLEENDRRQKQFISDASHELKTPVAVIGTNAEMLEREIGGNEWLGNIRYENERMGELVKQLLDLSRAESGETPTEQVDLSRTVTGEILAFESIAFEKGKQIESEIEEGITVQGNRTQLAQLTSVLTDNAIRHSTGEKIGISLQREGHEAILRTENEGNEIPPEQLEHLFDRFYRVDEARNSEGQHYGLGLSIAKAVAERHGGSIRAESRDGRVRFTVRIPVIRI